MKLFKNTLIISALTLFNLTAEEAKSPAAQPETSSEWENLLEGNSLDKWRSMHKGKDGEYKAIGDRWQVKDGILSLDFDREGRGGHIETKKNYFHFELKFDFNIKENCNSGVKYRCKHATGFEYQIIDDVNYRDNKIPSHRTAGLYEIAGIPEDRVLNPAGEWNTAKIVANGNTIEHWLNGVKVLTIEYGSEDWKQRFEKSKYFRGGKMDFGTHVGPIHFQDHSDTKIEFKNVFIRELK